MINLRFKVLGDWQNGNTSLDYVGTPLFTVAQYGGTCNTYFGFCMDAGGTITIPAYEAEYTAEWSDGGILSAVDDVASLQINTRQNG